MQCVMLSEHLYTYACVCWFICRQRALTVYSSFDCGFKSWSPDYICTIMTWLLHQEQGLNSSFLTLLLPYIVKLLIQFNNHTNGTVCASLLEIVHIYTLQPKAFSQHTQSFRFLNANMQIINETHDAMSWKTSSNVCSLR